MRNLLRRINTWLIGREARKAWINDYCAAADAQLGSRLDQLDHRA